MAISKLAGLGWAASQLGLAGSAGQLAAPLAGRSAGQPAPRRGLGSHGQPVEHTGGIVGGATCALLASHIDRAASSTQRRLPRRHTGGLR